LTATGNISAPTITHNTTYTPTGLEPLGTTYWNSTDGTLDLIQDGATQQIGQELFIKVINKSGALIENGSPVYFNGRQGNRPKIYLARSDVHSTSMVRGLTTQDIANNDEGFITTFGYIRQIKTNYSGTGNWGTTWAEGDKLWTSKTIAGQLTNVQPAIPHHADVIGCVGVVGSAGVGSIQVNIARHQTLEDLSDVNGTPLTTDGQMLTWHNTAGYFDFDKNINSYEPLVTKGNLTETTSSVLTITGGTGAVIGLGSSIQVKQASGSQSGYLSSTDWNTFSSKQNAGSYEVTTNKATDFTTINNTLYPTVQAVNTAIATAVTGLWDDRGTFSALAGAYPITGGSGTAGAILKGDIWSISVAGTLPTGQVVEIGDTIRALIDTPGQTQANWGILQNNIGFTAENIANKVTSISGSSTDTQYPSAKLVFDQLALKAPIATPTFTTNITTPLIIGGTASGSNITYKSTTGTGTSSGIAHQFVGGTNGGTTAMTILNNGNIGIGTETPTTKIGISTNTGAGVTSTLSVTNTNTTQDNVRAGVTFFGCVNANATPDLIGSFYSATNASSALTVVTLRNHYTSGLLNFITSNNAGTAQFNHMYLDSSSGSARVSINKASPTETLDVNGNARATQGIFPILRSATDGTSAVNITKADGTTSIIKVDSTNSRVGIATSGTLVSTLTVTGSLQLTQATKTFTDTGYVTTATDYAIFWNCTGGNSTINLISAVGRGGIVYIIKKTDATANTLTINANSTQTIDGALTKVLTVKNHAVMLMSDGANWQVISSNLNTI